MGQARAGLHNYVLWKEGPGRLDYNPGELEVMKEGMVMEIEQVVEGVTQGGEGRV